VEKNIGGTNNEQAHILFVVGWHICREKRTFIFAGSSTMFGGAVTVRMVQWWGSEVQNVEAATGTGYTVTDVICEVICFCMSFSFILPWIMGGVM